MLIRATTESYESNQFLQPYFLKTHFNPTLPSTPRSYADSQLKKYEDQLKSVVSKFSVHFRVFQFSAVLVNSLNSLSKKSIFPNLCQELNELNQFCKYTLQLERAYFSNALFIILRTSYALIFNCQRYKSIIVKQANTHPSSHIGSLLYVHYSLIRRTYTTYKNVSSRLRVVHLNIIYQAILFLYLWFL